MNQLTNCCTCLDLIYEIMDILLREDNYFAIDDVLQNLVVEDKSTTILLSFLTITHAAKPYLHQYEVFYYKVKRELSERDPSRVDELLMGLE